jgi:FAD:protein FMN transferase
MNFKILFFIIVVLAVAGCEQPKPKYIYNEGIIHGAPYKVVYKSPAGKDFHVEIDTLLKDLNMIFSTYEKESVISKVNRNEEVELDSIFTTAFLQSVKISELSGGAFDITCGPLVNAWGFGPEERKIMTPEKVDSLLQITGYQKITLENGKLIKENPNMKINMNAIGDGLFCDMVARMLEQKKCPDYLVEIGGVDWH